MSYCDKWYKNELEYTIISYTYSRVKTLYINTILYGINSYYYIIIKHCFKFYTIIVQQRVEILIFCYKILLWIFTLYSYTSTIIVKHYKRNL